MDEAEQNVGNLAKKLLSIINMPGSQTLVILCGIWVAGVGVGAKVDNYDSRIKNLENTIPTLQQQLENSNHVIAGLEKETEELNTQIKVLDRYLEDNTDYRPPPQSKLKRPKISIATPPPLAYSEDKEQDSQIPPLYGSQR